jgi:hypothetical protein
LDQRKAEAARRAIELKLANIKMVGDSDYGLLGLFTHPNLPEVILPHTDWESASGEELLENLLALMKAYDQQGYGVHTANYMALPTDAFFAVNTERLDLQQATTVLAHYKTMFPEVEVVRIRECDGIRDGQDVGLLYERDVTNLSHELVMPFNQLPPEARNLEFVTNCLARSAGVQLWYPLALASFVTSDAP